MKQSQMFLGAFCAYSPPLTDFSSFVTPGRSAYNSTEIFLLKSSKIGTVAYHSCMPDRVLRYLMKWKQEWEPVTLFSKRSNGCTTFRGPADTMLLKVFLFLLRDFA